MNTILHSDYHSYYSFCRFNLFFSEQFCYDSQIIIQKLQNFFFHFSMNIIFSRPLQYFIRYSSESPEKIHNFLSFVEEFRSV